jgi:hypothetical protein
LEKMTLPRVLITPHLMGKVLGAPDDHARQRTTLLAALDLLADAKQAGTIVSLG